MSEKLRRPRLKVNTKVLSLLVTLLSLSSMAASAASISFNSSIPLAQTNWNTTATLPKFDPSLGILTKVEMTLTGSVLGNIRLESLDASPASLSAQLAANITATAPSALVVTAIPAYSVNPSATAFDGSTDFGGTSGFSYLNVSGTDSDSASLTMNLSPYLATFIGETFNVSVAASGTSAATGAGNLISLFNTSAEANVKVTYYYETAAVPVPASVWCGAALLGGIVLRRMRHR